MTRRLSNELDQRLDEFLERAHQTSAMEAANKKILTRDKELFDRLADA